MKRLSVVVALAIILLTSCGKDLVVHPSGEIVKVSYPAVNYASLYVRQDVAVVLCDSLDSIVVTADAAIQPHVKVLKSGNTLEVGYPDVSWAGRSIVKVEIPMSRSLRRIYATGSCSVESDVPIDVRKAEVELSGRARLFIPVFADEAVVRMSGNTYAEFAGLVGEMGVNLSDNAKMISLKWMGAYLMGVDCLVGELSDDSEMCVHCDGEIECALSDDSRLYYTGHASTRKSTCRGDALIIRE